MSDRELMQQALHTLEGWANHGEWVWPESALEQAKRNTIESIAALRERLAQPEQEPVCDKDPQGCWNVRCQLGKVCKHAAPRQWQGLTEEEINNSYMFWIVDQQDIIGFGKSIEAKLREKNT